MNVNPVMIYAGQELGEPGMDSEGFSGCDGRTSIFDYWCVASLRTWYNNGHPDENKLTVAQQRLRAFYARLLPLCNSEVCIREGGFYDLMYANPQLNGQYQYVYLRCHDGEFVLVAVNFSDSAVAIQLHISAEAFAWMGICPSDVKQSTDLLTGDQQRFDTFGVGRLSLNLEALSGKLLKFGNSVS
jgi:hypothetical protein